MADRSRGGVPRCNRFVSLLYLWSMSGILLTVGFSQVVSIHSGGAGPQAKTRDELDAFGKIYDQTDPHSTKQMVIGFVKRYPRSEFLEYAQMAGVHACDRLAEPNEATAMAQVVLKLNPKNVDALLTSARLLVEEPGDPRNEIQRHLLAKDYAQQGLSELRLFTLPPFADKHAWVRTKKKLLALGYGVLGQVAFDQKKFKEALTNLTKATDLDPEGSYFYRLGLVYAAKGQLDLARASFSRAQMLGPEEVSRLAAKGLESSTEKQDKSSD